MDDKNLDGWMEKDRGQKRRQWNSELGPGVVLLVAGLCRGYRCGMRKIKAEGRRKREDRFSLRSTKVWDVH